jgi:hypothetical protein
MILSPCGFSGYISKSDSLHVLDLKDLASAIFVDFCMWLDIGDL